MNNYDVGIIGAGVSGAFALLKIAQDCKNIKTILFDLGRPPMKRRRQLEGWLGCLPNSDGKFYLSDSDKVSKLTGIRKTRSATAFVQSILRSYDVFKINKDKLPSSTIIKKFKKIGYDCYSNDYIQIYPKDIHTLSKHIAEVIEQNKNITLCFDREVINIHKNKSMFIITTDDQEYKCKKIILCVGRSGWRWAKKLYSDFGIIDNNDTAKFGIRIEMNSGVLKDFNKSTCSMIKGQDLELGPICWNGTVIPEDHVDVAISAFRSNENRWKTDKVSFSLIGNRPFPNSGFEQTDRLSKLIFILANDRIVKERVFHIITGKSKISILPEYNWIKDSIIEISSIIPEIINKAYYHVPTITPLIPQINIGTNLETEIEGLYVAGESSGISGLFSAATTGVIAANMICK